MPARLKFQLPCKGATEFRIHGVGGTTAETLLDHPQPVQVSGDDRAGFFRHPDPPGTDRPGKCPDATESESREHNLEAYSWGGLTSRSATRALWILLLPFTLTNVAGWMVVRRGQRSDDEAAPLKDKSAPDRLAGLQERLIRVVALLCTVLTVVGVAALTADLIALQCGGSAACRADRWWMKPFNHDSFNAFPGDRLALGIAPAVLVLLVLTLLSLRNRRRYDSYSPGRDLAVSRPTEEGDGEPPEAGDGADLTHLHFWYRPSLVGDLIFLHFTAGMATLALLVSTSAAELHTDQAPKPLDVPTTVKWTQGLSAAVLLMAIALTLFIRFRRRPADPKELLYDKRTISNVWYWLLAGGSVAIFIWTVWETVLLNLPYPELGLHTIRRAPLYVLGVAGGVGVALGLSQIVWWGTRGRLWRGKPLLLALQVLLIGVVVAAVCIREPWLLPAVAGLVIVALLVRRLWWTLCLSALPLAIGGVIWALGEDERYFVAACLVTAVAGGFAFFDYEWPRLEFRWGGPTIMATFGVILLGAVLAGILSRSADVINREQAPRELGRQVADVLIRNQDLGDADLGVKTIDRLADEIEDFYYDKRGEVGRDQLENLMETSPVLGNESLPAELIRVVSAYADNVNLRPIIIYIPDGYKWFTVGLFIALVLTIAAGGLGLVRHRFDTPPEPDARASADKPPEAVELSTKHAKKLNKKVRTKMTVKEMAGGGDLLITFLVGSLALAAAVGIAHVWNELGFSPGEWIGYGFSDELSTVLTPASWVTTALPLLAILAIRRSYSDQASRRKIGILWDLGTFWPRRFHPLTPPSYSERAVPELRDRIEQASKPGQCAVVSAHSQGSIVAHAALLPMEKEDLSRVTLTTYGSPLGSLYRRFFPAYFDTDNFKNLQTKLGGANETSRWRNFWRPTDPIGGCVFTENPEPADPRDTRLPDPWWWWRIPGQPLPHIQGHSDYMDDPKMRSWIENAARECARKEVGSENIPP